MNLDSSSSQHSSTSSTADVVDPPRLSVVVPAFNVSQILCQQLDALHDQLVAHDAELVVIDDCSADTTATVAAEWLRRHPEIKGAVKRARTRVGPNGSRNAGVAFTSGDLIAFTDGDDIVRPGWLDVLSVEWADDAIIGGIGVSDASSPTSPRTFFGWRYAIGTSMALSRSLLRTTRGFDERIVRGGTEVEFAIRAQLQGANFNHRPGAVVWHRDSDHQRTALRRSLTRQRGHCLIARRYSDDLKGADQWLEIGTNVRQVARMLGDVVTGPGEPRRRLLARCLVLMNRMFWIVRFRISCPKPLLLTNDVTQRYEHIYSIDRLGDDGSA